MTAMPTRFEPGYRDDMKTIASILGLWLALLASAFAAPDVRTVRAMDTVDEVLALEPAAVSKGGRAEIWVSGLSQRNEFPLRLLAFDRASAESTNLFVFGSGSWTGRWIFPDRSNLVHDTRWYRVRPNATNDQAALLQAALDAGPATLEIPEGTHWIGSPLVVTRAGQTLQGKGTIAELSILTNLVRVAADNVRIEGLRLLGSETADTFVSDVGFDRIALFAQNVTNFSAERVAVLGKSTGISIDGGETWAVRRSQITGFWRHTNYVSGINNGAGIVTRDSSGKAIDNEIFGTGQGVCALNKTNDWPTLNVEQNLIQECGDNGVYLVAAGPSTIKGNRVFSTRGTGIKAHGSDHIISGNVMTNVGLGIAAFPIHAVPAVGTREYHLSTNKWGSGTTNWITGLGTVVSGNTIRFAGRHGIDAGYTRISPNTFWNSETSISGNTISEYGSSANDVGIRLSGDSMRISGGTISGCRGTSSSFGILFGGQAETDLGWRDFSVTDVTIVGTQNFEAGIQATDITGLDLQLNRVINPASVLGIVLVGASDVRGDINRVLYDGQIRCVGGTNVVLVNNIRASVVQVEPVVGLSETRIDSTQLTTEAIRTALASQSATYPWAMTVETNAQRGFQVWNKSGGPAALATVQINVGTTNSASGQIAVFSRDYTGQFAGRMVLNDNSDTDGVTVHAARTNATVDVGVSGTTLLSASPPSATGESGVLLYLYDSGTRARIMRSASYGLLYTGTDPALGTMARKDDAPTNSSYYARQNGAWTSFDFQPADSDLAAIAAASGASDLVGGGDTSLHYHSADRARANHTGTQALSTISDAGTAAARNVPASGNAATNEVVLGTDTRLSDARTPASHTHPASEVSDSTSAGRALLTAANAAAQRSSLGLAAMAEVADAPSDGTGYVRKNGSWAAELGGGGGGSPLTITDDFAAEVTNVTRLKIQSVDLFPTWLWQVTGVGSNAVIQVSEITPPLYVNNDGTEDGRRYNLNDSTPAAPSGAMNVRWQKSGTNASAYVPVAPTIGGITPTVIITNSTSWGTITSFNISDVNLPNVGDVVSGDIVVRLDNSASAVTGNFGVLVNTETNLQVGVPSIASAFTPRPLTFAVSIARTASDKVQTSATFTGGNASAPTVGFGAWASAATVTSRNVVGVETTIDLSTNNLIVVRLAFDTASTNIVATTQHGGFK